MTNEWILDVLADLKAFAVKNGLPALEEQMSDAMLVAANELASTEGSVPEVARQGTSYVGSLHRANAASGNA